MAHLPKQYLWLLDEPGPKMLKEMLKLYGTYEIKGAADSEVIMNMARALGLQRYYLHDETAWCGLGMAYVAKMAGYKPVSAPLWALNWASWGEPAKVAKLGYVLVKKRFDKNGKPLGGHVTMYVGEDAEYYHCLGCNQSDSCNITRIAKRQFIAIRKPDYAIGEPANVRQIFLDAEGNVSDKED